MYKRKLNQKAGDSFTVNVEVLPEPGIDKYHVKIEWPASCSADGAAEAQLSRPALQASFAARSKAQTDNPEPFTIVVTPEGQAPRRFKETLERTTTANGAVYDLAARKKRDKRARHKVPPAPAPGNDGPILDPDWRIDLTFDPPLPVDGEALDAVVEFDALAGAESYEVVIGEGAVELGKAPKIVWDEARRGPRVREAIRLAPSPKQGAHLIHATVKAKLGKSKARSGYVEASLKVLQQGRGGADHEILNALKSNFDDVVGRRLAGAVDSVASQLRSANSNGLRFARASDPFAGNPVRAQFWKNIRQSTERLGFAEYQRFMDQRFCNPGNRLPRDVNMQMPFSQVDTYLRLKGFTELFLLQNAGVLPDQPGETARSQRANPDRGAVLRNILAARPYLQIVLQDNADFDGDARNICERLRYPVLIELIWSYWHEESMLVQAMHAIKVRFQNRTRVAGRDPLANLEMDPLRPLNNILWGYIQDEQHRLGVRQRSYEYLHHYGISLEGKAIGNLRPADSRRRFLQAFHTLLYQCVQYYRQADDTMVVANANNVLWALRDLHLLLAEGAHNQYGDLPWNARLEMLMEQWILSRPEIQDFLRARRMVPYPESWMGAVDSMKTLQRWSGTNVIHFRDLGTFGERVLLSVREGGVAGIGGWSVVSDPIEAAAFATEWRAEIEGYINAYRAVTGVDLTQDPADPRFLAERDAAPSVHLQRRLAAGSGL